MTEPLVYIKGEMVPASQAHVAIYDGAVVLGATVAHACYPALTSPLLLEDTAEEGRRYADSHHEVEAGRVVMALGIAAIFLGGIVLLSGTAEDVGETSDIINPGAHGLFERYDRLP